MAAASMAGVVAAALGWRRFVNRPWPKMPNGQPLLRMPFPAGTVVLCEQGNASPSGTHSPDSPQNTFALDFANRAEDSIPIAAAAPGTVVFVLSDAPPNDPDGGLGYGNQVRVVHDDGFSTFYSHLAEVSVRVGQRVESGTVLGTMGRTGLAGGRHLHFSLHRAHSEGPGASETLPISGLLAIRMDAGVRRFVRTPGKRFHAEHSVPWDGGLYGSENGGALVEGEAPPEFAERLARAAKRLELSLRPRSLLAAVARTPDDPVRAREQVAPILHADPNDPVALYMMAAHVLIPERKLLEARSLLERAHDRVTPRTFEPWIAAFATAQLGIVDHLEGDAAGARARFQEALGGLQSEALASMILPYVEEHTIRAERQP